MHNVTIKQLRAFVMLAEQRSFTRAAARLGISQSALTLQIKDLEAEVGVRLFDRSTRSLDLTVHATEFLPVATRMLDQLSRGIEDLLAVAGREKGRVSIAAGASVISVLVTPALARLSKSHPKIEARLMDTPGADVERHVLNGDADFGIAALTRSHSLLAERLLLKDRIGVLLRVTHPLNKKRNALMWRDLGRYPFGTFRVGTQARDVLDRHSQLGPSCLPRPAYEVWSVSALLALAKQGAAPAVLPWASAIPAISSGCIFRPLQGPVLWRELHVICLRRRSLTPAAQLLLEAILDEVNTLSRCTNGGANVHVGDIAGMRTVR